MCIPAADETDANTIFALQQSSKSSQLTKRRRRRDTVQVVSFHEDDPPADPMLLNRRRLAVKFQHTILIEGSRNVLAVIYGRIYFPAYSNGLKDIASFLGF